MFDIPLYDTPRFQEFLSKQAQSIYSIYYRFSGVPNSIDARNATSKDMELNPLPSFISSIPKGIKKFCLLNTRVLLPTCYETQSLKEIETSVSTYYYNNWLDGLIVTDFMFLRSLSETLPFEVVQSIEIVPSINMGISSVSQAQSILSHIESMGFPMPPKLVLDRSLNRQPKILEQIRKWQDESYPNLKITLLVNEGCLPYCPLKVSHDCLISIFNQSYSDSNAPLHVFRNFGCRAYMANEYYHYLTSPILRPEDLTYVEPFYDVIKIAGRTHSDDFIMKCFDAYAHESWNGNLIELIDTAFPLRSECCIDNSRIPKNFYSRTSTCDLNCNRCGYCKRVFEDAVVKIEKDNTAKTPNN